MSKNISTVLYIAILTPIILLACTSEAPQTLEKETLSNIQTAPDTYSDYPLSVQKKLASCGVDEDELYRLLRLDYHAFDQNFNGGWRQIDYKDNCQDAAAYMIKSYLTLHEYSYKSQRSTLVWHTGQVLANNGQYDEAITYFNQAYKMEANQNPWNLYVEGTIAFLRKDKDHLIKLRDELASMPVPEALKASRRKFLKDNPNITMPEGFVDDPQNLSVMNDLITCFNDPYSTAYGNCEE